MQVSAAGRGRARGGFRSIPYAMELELRALPVTQRSVLTSLAFEAQYGAAAVVDVDGVQVTIDVGEAFVSIRRLAAALRLGPGSKGESLVRRSLESGCRIGLISKRPARPTGSARPGGPSGAPRSAPRDAPPTIVRFLRHRRFLWPTEAPDAPHDTRGDAPRDAQGDAIPVAHEIPRGPQQQQRPPPQGEYPATEQLAAALTDRWREDRVEVVPPGPGQPHDEIEAAVRSLGLEAAVEECVADGVAAVHSGRVETIPSSVGFFARRLITAAARRAARAAGGAR